MPITKTYYKVHRVFPDPDYFYLENISGKDGYFFVERRGTPASTDLAYSFDKVTWTDIHNGGRFEIANGAKVYFRSSTGFSLDSSNFYAVRLTTGAPYYSNIPYNAGGHISTLLDYNNVNNINSIPNYSFYSLFKEADRVYGSGIVHANIDFFGIKTLGENSLHYSFLDCSELVTIPDFSEVETINNYTFEQTFKDCSSLTTPADLSNVTTVGSWICRSMYEGCTSLTTAIAPNISTWDTNQFSNWLKNTASTGVVRKPAGLEIPTDSTSGVPTGWTTVDY